MCKLCRQFVWASSTGLGKWVPASMETSGRRPMTDDDRRLTTDRFRPLRSVSVRWRSWFSSFFVRLRSWFASVCVRLCSWLAFVCVRALSPFPSVVCVLLRPMVFVVCVRLCSWCGSKIDSPAKLPYMICELRMRRLCRCWRLKMPWAHSVKIP